MLFDCFEGGLGETVYVLLPVLLFDLLSDGLLLLLLFHVLFHSLLDSLITLLIEIIHLQPLFLHLPTYLLRSASILSWLLLHFQIFLYGDFLVGALLLLFARFSLFAVLLLLVLFVGQLFGLIQLRVLNLLGEHLVYSGLKLYKLLFGLHVQCT